MNHGLAQHDIDTIGRILAIYADVITQVDLFGSRAVGNYRPNSDVDIVLRGNLTEKEVDRLWTLFQESNLPYSVDVKSYELTRYRSLKEHIDNASECLFSQDELKGFQAAALSASDS